MQLKWRGAPRTNSQHQQRICPQNFQTHSMSIRCVRIRAPWNAGHVQGNMCVRCGSSVGQATKIHWFFIFIYLFKKKEFEYFWSFSLSLSLSLSLCVWPFGDSFSCNIKRTVSKKNTHTLIPFPDLRGARRVKENNAWKRTQWQKNHTRTHPHSHA